MTTAIDYNPPTLKQQWVLMRCQIERLTYWAHSPPATQPVNRGREEVSLVFKTLLLILVVCVLL